jgi:hypothetical protein
VKPPRTWPKTDQPFACGTVCRLTPHGQRAERRISRNGHDQRLSQYVTASPESERPYRRLSVCQ